MIVSYACDIGSIKLERFGWARAITAEFKTEVSGGTSIDRCAEAISADLASGHRVALGIECPAYMHIPESADQLGRGRPNERSRSMFAPAGGYVALLGIQQLSYLLSKIERGTRKPTFELSAWSEDNILLWEAFVSEAAHSSEHVRDAATAAVAFLEATSNGVPQSALPVGDAPVLSLAGCALLWAGWTAELEVLRRPLLVLRPTAAYAGSIAHP